MKRKTLLVAAIAASLALGSVAALAETGVPEAVETNTEAPAVEAPAFAVQTQLRTLTQDPELMGTDDPLTATVRTSSQFRVDKPAECDGECVCDGECEAPLTQERAEVRSEWHNNGEATQAGDLLGDPLRDRVRDPADGDCDGECDGPINTQDEIGAGNQYRPSGGNS